MAFSYAVKKVYDLGATSGALEVAVVTATNGGADTSATITSATLSAATGWPTDKKMGSFVFCAASDLTAEKAAKIVTIPTSITLTCASGDSFELMIVGDAQGV